MPITASPAANPPKPSVSSASSLLGQFANLFRGALAGPDGHPLPRATKLSLVRDYLDIERARLRFTLPAWAHPPTSKSPPSPSSRSSKTPSATASPNSSTGARS